MDWELIWWLVVPPLLLLVGFILEGRKMKREQDHKDWEWEHQDDFNKDL